MKIRKRFTSRDGVSYKYLQETDDHHFIETGLFDIGETAICISTQIGCPLGCVFCASTKPVDTKNPELKYIRNLSVDEIIQQVENVMSNDKQLSKDVMLSYMGIGEPFLNYEAVIESIRRLAKHKKIKRATIATSGVKPELIRKLAKEKFSIPVKIQLSLHASNQTLRKRVMPGSTSLSDALDATYYFAKETGQNIKVNFILIKGINDRKEEAVKLAELLLDKNDLLSVKLMRLQPIGDLVEAPESSFKLFEDILDSHQIRHDRYLTDGRDIQSNCGQLRRYYFSDEAAVEPHDIEHIEQIERALNENLVNDLATILKKNGERVSEVEMTNNNFDDKENLIRGKIPTITTEVGEIGFYDSTVYLTMIFPSTVFTQELFDIVKNYEDVHIYGLKKFHQDYYPGKDFDFGNLKKNISSEDYFQVQFNFRNESPKYILEKYLEISLEFQKLNVAPVNQMKVDLSK